MDSDEIGDMETDPIKESLRLPAGSTTASESRGDQWKPLEPQAKKAWQADVTDEARRHVIKQFLASSLEYARATLSLDGDIPKKVKTWELEQFDGARSGDGYYTAIANIIYFLRLETKNADDQRLHTVDLPTDI